MQQPNNRRRIVIIAGAVVFVVAVVLVLLKPKPQTTQQSSGVGKTTVYHDPVSGEDIVHQDGKAPEGEVSSPTQPLFVGFDKLVNKGLTLDQVQSLYAALVQYAPFASDKVQISLAADDLQPIEPQNSDPLYRWSIKSHIVVNRTTTYKIQVYYWGVSPVELLLDNASGTQLFDSGTVDTYASPDT